MALFCEVMELLGGEARKEDVDDYGAGLKVLYPVFSLLPNPQRGMHICCQLLLTQSCLPLSLPAVMNCVPPNCESKGIFPSF